jgi:hypothetical protein
MDVSLILLLEQIEWDVLTLGYSGMIVGVIRPWSDVGVGLLCWPDGVDKVNVTVMQPGHGIKRAKWNVNHMPIPIDRAVDLIMDQLK